MAIGSCELCGVVGKFIEKELESEFQPLFIQKREFAVFCGFCSKVIDKSRALLHQNKRTKVEIADIGARIKNALKLRPESHNSRFKSTTEVGYLKKINEDTNFGKETHQAVITAKQNANSGPLDCYFCHKPLAQLQDLELHLCMHTRESSINCGSREKNSGLPADKANADCRMGTFNCNVENCRKTYKSRSALGRHKIHAHGGRKPLSCFFCQGKMVDALGLLEHMNGIHLKEFPYSCKRGNCRFKSARRRDWRSHMMKKHKEEWNIQKEAERRKKPEAYKCSQCPRVFNKNGSLWYHLKSHQERHPHSCHICSKTYRLESNLKGHMVNEHGLDSNAAYRCPHQGCKRPLFSTKLRLSHHIRNQHSLEKATCPDCGREQKNQASLRAHFGRCHSRNGQNKSKFQCKFPGCAVSCYSGSVLKNHTNAVHNAQNFTRLCEICGSRFKYRKQLTEHMVQTHGGVPCSYCLKKYTNFKHLAHHIRVTHCIVNKEFSCGIGGCKRNFKFHSDWQHHVLKSHNENQQNACYFCYVHFPTRRILYGHLLRKHLRENPSQVQ